MQQLFLTVFAVTLFFVHGAFASDWLSELKSRADVRTWEAAAAVRPQITPEALDAALEAARAYYLNQQLVQGNFLYALDIIDNTEDSDDNQVRQAGALWGLSNLNRERFTEDTRRGVLLGLDFWMRNQRMIPSIGTRAISYKGQRVVKTGTVALFCLALVDFLEGQEKYLSEEQRKPYQETLYNNMRFLQSLELADGSWRDAYDAEDPPVPGTPGKSSPYYDGESLLAYLTVAKYYAARPQVKAPAGIMKRVELALPLLLKRYVVESLRPDGNPNLTKGFFQWGLMSCALYCETHTGPDADMAAEAGLALAWWQIFGNRVHVRHGNTGYAIEGLVAAWRIATSRNLTAEAQRLREVIEDVLGRLMTWQVGGPFEHLNPFLQFWKSSIPKRAFGGITAACDNGYVRIDIVQHQVHAMLLARKYLWP